MATNTPAAVAVSLSRVLVDFSAFAAERTTGDVNLPVHIIKEMTIVDIDSGCYQTWIYKQPKESYHWDGSEPLEKHNQWLIDHYHGLEYHLGFADYESLTDTLNHHCGRASLLFAANRVKTRILEDLLYMKQAVYTWRCGSNGTRRPGHYSSRCVRYVPTLIKHFFFLIFILVLFTFLSPESENFEFNMAAALDADESLVERNGCVHYGQRSAFDPSRS